VIYFLKGADSIMIPTLKAKYAHKTEEDTALLSAQGLRTLVVTQAIITME
jgi:magnesium-transporting ATPase (P-type)